MSHPCECGEFLRVTIRCPSCSRVVSASTLEAVRKALTALLAAPIPPDPRIVHCAQEARALLDEVLGVR